MSIPYIDDGNLVNKKILLRVDFNVSLNPDFSIADDVRIQQSLPTIKKLLENRNKLILVSHLGRPQDRDEKFSLKNVAARLQEYIKDKKVILVNDFITDDSQIKNQKDDEVLMLENIRFYPEEKSGSEEFAKKLASLAEVYVNDAFGVSHRADASVVAITKFLPSYGGLLLKKEIEMISKVIENPRKPFLAIIGGAKIETKIDLIGKLTEMADTIIIGGGLANTFLCGEGYSIGKSYCEYEKVNKAKELLALAKKNNTEIVLPADGAIATGNGDNSFEIKKISEIPEGGYMLDIGPETQAAYGAVIAKANTIVWNGPVGYIENPSFRSGTDFIYYSMTINENADTIVGGGDTLAAISKKEYLDKIDHISTGGGAMLEFIEKGTLPGIEALKQSMTSH